MDRRSFVRRALALGVGAATSLLPKAERAGEWLHGEIEEFVPIVESAPPFLYDVVQKTWWRFVAGEGYRLFHP